MTRPGRPAGPPGRRASRRRIPLIALFLGLGLLGACTHADPDAEALNEEAAATEGSVPSIPYGVDFVPADGAAPLPADLAGLMRQASEAERLTSRPPASELIIQRRAETDLPRLVQAMRSLGYYDGAVDFRIEQVRPLATDGEGRLLQGIETWAGDAPTRLVYRVTPGPLYRLTLAKLVIDGATADYVPPDPATFGLAVGEPAAAQRILDAEQQILAHARDDGRPLAKLNPREAVVDHESRAMEVTLHLAPGPRADFGPITFTGSEEVDRVFLDRTLPFEAGEPFDARQLDRGRQSLIQTNLFATVVVRTPDALDADGRLPVTFELSSRAARSIGAGIGYQTDEGVGGKLFWEHRNFFGAGERFRAETNLSQRRQQAKVSLTKPNFLISRLRLVNEIEAKKEDTEAYEGTSLSAGTGLQYAFTDKVLGGLGVSYRYADIDDNGEKQTYGLVSFPASVDWDFSNDLLDPSEGGRVLLTGAPFFDTLGTGIRFQRGQVTHTRYIPLLADRRLVLALRGSLGAMTGASRADIPADERFYSGGGGSVRGIAYQLAGPLDDDDEPLGGRSLAEFSTELRTRVTETIGAVVFLDGGSVFDTTYPDFSEPLRLGTGVGARYITAIGPIRVDVGIPLDRRSGVDDAYQLYISIGQAF